MELAIIQNRIYDIRGQKVMIDRDLAELYQVETRRLNEAVKRNIKRFPSDFMFQLTKGEFESLMSQFATSNRGGTRKLPFAFTEQGLAMLSGVLNSDVAIEVNISIMRAFVAIRRTMVMSPDNDIKRLQNEMKELKEYIEDVFTDYNDINDDTRVQLELINQAIAQLQGRGRFPETHKPVGYDVILKEIEKSK
ncbi:ORF6N domain-containing protein [Parabacteroides sp. AF17-28]|uniref:ORF6N domain-containing protein n=1 Tax=Parabacteroides sp. AF17-28 TaxID=2292241 RepID=UPI000F00927C|nr:ORF6N domain-containing protein [Parabacteroides sp. AF17-28]RHR58261.1 ORF6N domain-containing protein [Parabacteroides sp. AF17-28]